MLIDEPRSLRARLRSAWNASNSLEVLGVLIGLTTGAVALGYVALRWVLHWVQVGQWLYAACALVATVALVLGSVLRVPIAMVLLFGAGAGVLAFYGSGHSGLLLP